MQKYLIILSLTALFLAPAQKAKSQLLSADQLPGLKIAKESIFDGTSLYGYIDGGSTLYFEYGFERLTVQEVVFQDQKINLEYFRMKSCKGAFGIYSINTFQCQAWDQQGRIDCENPYQQQLCAGHFYISVVNAIGTAAARGASTLLVKKLKEVIPAEEGLLLPEQIRDPADQLTGSVKYIRGELGLQNGLPDFSNYFEGITNFELWIRQSSADGKDQRKFLLSFDTAVALESFVHNASLVPSGNGWKSKESQAEKWTAVKMGEQTLLVEIK